MAKKNYTDAVAEATADLDFANKTYQIKFVTSKGEILLDLYPDVAPGHCKNIIGLTKVGFYDGLCFHRVISGFVIQGGCPEGSGMGGPGYQIKAEFNKKLHQPGTLSMARAQDPDSGGSQFFLCLEAVPFLDNQYTVFGQTANSESLAVVKAIGSVATGAQDRPHQEVTIIKAEVLES